jgi:glycosyltransferase involved in cell wall biosynthesis
VTAGTLIPYGRPPHVGHFARFGELWQIGFQLWRRRNQFDLVHSFGRLAALLPILSLRALPKIQSYQRAIPWGGVKRAVYFAGSSLHFTGCSASLYQGQLTRRGGVGHWRTVFNGVEVAKYNYVSSVRPDAPLVFLGRLESIKGPHHAVAIAKRSGRRLILAGNPRDGACSYFTQQIAPHIDGSRVEYVGAVTDEQKNVLLGAAAALLMPIEWDEPFGIVMAEAMACGTPVIGFARGSVPEVIRDGVNGFLCRTVDEAAAAVARIETVNRFRVRIDCEARFSSAVIVDAYERLYQELRG